MVKIALNAHLLSGSAGYRSAGIHGYMFNTLAQLPAAAPEDWQFTVFAGAQTQSAFERMALRRSRWNTESPTRRIVWEQAIQPFQLGGFDLYHALAFVSPLLLTTPSVVTVYDLSFIRYPGVLTTARRLYLRMFTALSCHRAQRVIGISQSTARDVVDLLGIPADKVDVALGAYNPEIFYPLPEYQVAAFRTAKGLPERFWFFVGTLEPRKNLPTLIEAYAALPRSERLPLILGGGKGWQYEPIFATIERHHLGNDIRLTGYLPADELPLWYNSAEAFVYPSVYEGFGLPVLEAMACGTPVIVSDASSLPEVVGEAGALIPPQDVEGWTEALRRAFHDTLWRDALRQRGLLRAQQFTWDATAAQTIRTYQRALALS